ncbi:MAG: extracellular solute-binding protein [Christensenellales bacterium]|jgi:ABC-type glycerol-3-phosphate transport system substrate-binding protein
MKKMKRILIALIALLTAVSAIPALGDAGNITIYRYIDGTGMDSLRAMAYYDSTLYLFTYGNEYYTWTREAGELQTFPFDQSALFAREDGYIDMRAALAGEDGLYAVTHSYDYSEQEEGSYRGGSTFDEARIMKMAFDADGNVTLDEGVELDWDDLIETYDEYEYAQDMRSPFLWEDKLVFTTYMSSGMPTVVVMDINTGDCELLEPDIGGQNAQIQGMTRYRDGQALIAVVSYDSGDNPLQFYVMDIETGDTEEAFSIESTNYRYATNLLYDEATDALYYTLSGELYRMDGLDPATAVSVAAVQIDEWSDYPPALTDDGFFICADYETVIARNTDPSARAAQNITVYTGYNRSLEEAYHTFSGKHPEVEVVLATNFESIIDAMMNQSSAVDIYTVYVGSEDYAALFDRGYLAELTDSDAITTLVEGMYDGIRAVVQKDGETLALPVELYTNVMSYNPVAFGKMGLTEDDVPTDWLSYLQLIRRAADLYEDAGVMVFELYMTQEDARATLFYRLINDYMVYLTKTPDAEMAFDTPLMRELLAELEAIDFTAYGLMEEYDDAEATRVYSSDNRSMFQTYGDVSVSVYSFQDEQQLPMPLSMDGVVPPMIEAQLSVAVVNPYSENRALAIEYLEHAAELFPQMFLANASPNWDEPIRNVYYEESYGHYIEQIESIEAELEKAAEEDKAEWEQQLADWQGYLAEFEEVGAWEASAESIAKYREYADYLVVSEFFGIGGENYEDFYGSIQQYLEGNIDAGAMLSGIDKKLKMMLLEGM